MPHPQLISCNPDPPKAGESCQICYDFDGTGKTETTLNVTFSPSTGSCGLHLTLLSPCATVTIPAEAYGMEVFDDLDISEVLAKVIEMGG